MDRDVVSRLVRLKRFRADRAEAELREARAAVTAALAAAGAAKQAVEDWRREMPSREAAIYASIIGRIVTSEALDDAKEAVVALRTEEALLAKRLDDAQTRVKEARAASDDAERRVAEARRNVEKFGELVQVLRRAAALDAAREEDATMEEAAGRHAGLDPDDSGAGEDAIKEGENERNRAA